MIACNLHDSLWHVRQVTFAAQNHELDHNENFSPDDVWLVYDTRPNPAGIQLNAKIEKVNVTTGETQVLYNFSSPSPYGPGVGAASYHPFLNQIVFLHGLEDHNAANPYAAHRRTGIIIDEANPEKHVYMDSRDVRKPYSPGALRGGTHRHQWSADGNWIGFTYNDAVMVDLEAKTGNKHDLRTVGVSKRLGPKVLVPQDGSAEQIQGEWFSAVLVRVVPNPSPGSDQISRAYEDWWIGKEGYRRPDGTWQRARAFMGDLIAADGSPITEVFVVDVPDAIDVPGEWGPLEGTDVELPAPPAGALVRRITRTEDRKYPGVSTVPRHWLSSSFDGAFISYLAKDERGVVQVYLVSPLGGEPIQATNQPDPVQTMVRWHPHERLFSYVCDNSLFLARVDEFGVVSEPVRITERTEETPFAHCWSRSGDQIAFNRYVNQGKESFIQIFVAENVE